MLSIFIYRLLYLSNYLVILIVLFDEFLSYLELIVILFNLFLIVSDFNIYVNVLENADGVYGFIIVCSYVYVLIRIYF